MSHKIAFYFEDGVTRFITALEGEKVADAAYRQGVNIPLDCREGACGTCKCHLEAGSVHMEDYVEDALSPAEEAAGQILSCKATPQGDCVIRLPVESEVCLKAPPAALNTTIHALEPLSSSAFLLTLEGADLGKLDFLPGQYANITVPGTDAHRAYSFSSLVDRAANRVSFLIRKVPEGLMSGYLAREAKVGDALTLRGPMGGFYLRPVTRPVLMLAGGTGLAPFLAMLELLRDKGTDQPIHLVYGVNTEADLVAVDQLEAFARALPTFDFTTCLATPEGDFPRKGYVTDFIAPEAFHHGNVDIYLCGPPPMVEAVERMIAERGITPQAIHYEKFLASK
jgi:benzoate/toluate 1,2-dioxygenase reductase subunit